MFTVKEILEIGTQIERNGESFYREALKRFSDPDLITLFERLAEDEVRHAHWFAERRDAIEKGLERERRDREEAENSILREILGGQSFSLKETDLSKLKGIEDVVKVALEFEEDTILFYEMIRSFLEDEVTVARLLEIIEEEKNHVQLLGEFRPV